MAKFTFLEIHLDDIDFSPKAPLSSIGGGDDEADEADEFDIDAEEWEADGPSPVKPLLVLVALIVLALVLRALLGGDDEELVEIET